MYFNIRLDNLIVRDDCYAFCVNTYDSLAQAHWL
jgi:hypothetical protein